MCRIRMHTYCTYVCVYVCTWQQWRSVPKDKKSLTVSVESPKGPSRRTRGDEKEGKDVDGAVDKEVKRPRLESSILKSLA